MGAVPPSGASDDVDSAEARRSGELVGLWAAERWSGPHLRGELTVERRGAEALVRIGGVAATASFDGDQLDAPMPHDLGRLRARVDGDVLRGHWIQPPGEFLNGAWATPVVLDGVPVAAAADDSSRPGAGGSIHSTIA